MELEAHTMLNIPAQTISEVAFMVEGTKKLEILDWQGFRENKKEEEESRFEVAEPGLGAQMDDQKK